MSLRAIGHIVQPPGQPTYPIPVMEALVAAEQRLHGHLAKHLFNDAGNSSLLTRATENFHKGAKLCESPIEQIMLAAMVFMAPNAPDWTRPAVHIVGEDEQWPVSSLVIAPQFMIARYRLDFLILGVSKGRRQWMAVECDGRDYHTYPGQRARDELRDHYLDRLDIKTHRFTGEWIHKNRERGVADEVEARIRDWGEAA